MVGHNIPGAYRSIIPEDWDRLNDIFIPEFLADFLLLHRVGIRRSGAMCSLPFVDSLARRPWGEP